MYARERDHLTHFLTYADNNAVGYFAKQGFTKEITLDRDRVRLFLHECTLTSSFLYLALAHSKGCDEDWHGTLRVCIQEF